MTKYSLNSLSNETTQHTPGPYYYIRAEDGWGECFEICSKATGDILVRLGFWPDEENGSVPRPIEANARLFTAAPDLLRVLRRFLIAVSELPEDKISWKLSEAVIDAKASIADLVYPITG